MSNTFGTLFRLTTFGESHGPAIGGVIDGCQAGVPIDVELIQHELDRRRPGQSSLTTARNEADRVHILSGIYNGYTTGTPIGFYIENTNQRSADYSELATAFRPNHADFTYHSKYKGFNDVRGGGRSSARETAARVVGGSIARQLLGCLAPGLTITSYTSSVGEIKLEKDYKDLDPTKIDANPVRCPDPETAARMIGLIEMVKKDGDTVGGTITCVVKGCPVGIGQPVFAKLGSKLAEAMMSINAARGFEIGDGFGMSAKRGSEVVDEWTHDDEDSRHVRTKSNHSGGIQGGLSNGEDIVFTVAFKPVATLLQDVKSVNRDCENVVIKAKGRHDPCVVPRAVPIVDAMTALVLADLLLIDRGLSL